MTDYSKVPRQRGLSDSPMMESNPRQWAKSRCDSAMKNLDNAFIRLGELIQVYLPSDTYVEDGIKACLEFAEYCKENGVTIDQLLEMQNNSKMQIPSVGDYPGYVVYAALLMQSIESIQETVKTLKRSI